MSYEEDALEFTHSGIERRQQLVQLAREGDLSLARELYGDGDPRVRASSVAVLSENDALDKSLIALGLSDPPFSEDVSGACSCSELLDICA